MNYTTNPTYKETIVKASKLLEEKCVPHFLENLYDGCAVCFYWCDGDFICHNGSYGCNSGLVESIGFPWDNGDVSVHTPEEIADLVANYYKREVKEI